MFRNQNTQSMFIHLTNTYLTTKCMKDINFPIVNSVTRKSLKQLLYKDLSLLKKLIYIGRYIYIYLRETFNRSLTVYTDY